MSRRVDIMKSGWERRYEYHQSCHQHEHHEISFNTIALLGYAVAHKQQLVGILGVGLV